MARPTFRKKSNSLNLVLEPSAGLFSGQSVEAAGFSDEQNAADVAVADSKTFVAGVDGSLKADEEGYFGEAGLFSKKSEFLSSTIKKNYWPTLSLTEAGKSHYPRLIKRSVIDRLEADLDPFGEAVKIESLLLGKVTFKGQNKEGFKVRIFGQEYQRPIYFSKLGKPNTSLTQTSSHGGFVFKNLPDGGYLIQVISNENILAQKWFVVRSGHISRGQLDLRERPERLVFLETFPAQAREDKDLEVSELGREQSSLEVNSLLAELRGIELTSKTSPSVTVLKISDASTRGGSKQLALISSKSSDVTLKRINTNWLNGFLNHQRSNRNNSLGMIVGFVEESNFELLAEATESLTKRSEIYYFDAKGNSTATGVLGGGFVITNTRLGFQPLVVKLQNQNRFLNKIVFTAPNALSVF